MKDWLKWGLISAGIVFILGLLISIYFITIGCETEGCIGLTLLIIYLAIFTFILMIFAFIASFITFSKNLRKSFWVGVIISIIVYFLITNIFWRNFFIRDFTIYWERLIIFPIIIFLSTFIGWIINKNKKK